MDPLHIAQRESLLRSSCEDSRLEYFPDLGFYWRSDEEKKIIDFLGGSDTTTNIAPLLFFELHMHILALPVISENI